MRKLIVKNSCFTYVCMYASEREKREEERRGKEEREQKREKM